MCHSVQDSSPWTVLTLNRWSSRGFPTGKLVHFVKMYVSSVIAVLIAKGFKRKIALFLFLISGILQKPSVTGMHADVGTADREYC